MFFISPTWGEQRKVACYWRIVKTVLILAALKPSANLGTTVGGGASGATSQLT
jgi:hypothetical protein